MISYILSEDNELKLKINSWKIIENMQSHADWTTHHQIMSKSPKMKSEIKNSKNQIKMKTTESGNTVKMVMGGDFTAKNCL